ncbi:MAG: hypothetical protein OER04_10300 [Cyclobacteriaceae bacterium]|nr:hypothetical protein [Cyclobacteriaceae bacterium]
MPALKWASNQLIICGLLLGLSCQQENRQTDLVYFDVNGFIEQQIATLKDLPCDLEKNLSMDDRGEIMNSESSKDSAFWAHEFIVFRDHDINKPVLRDAYTTSKGTDEAGNRFDQYQLRDPKQLGVRSMKVYYDSEGKITSWESDYREENVLYSSKRLVRMDLEKSENGYLLNSYSVAGYHKLVFKDTVHYQVMAKLHY